MQKKSAVHGKNTRVFETQNTKFDRRFGPFLVSRQLLLFCLLYMPPSRRFTADAGVVTDFFPATISHTSSLQLIQNDAAEKSRLKERFCY
jgi:hypothetical protein